MNKQRKVAEYVSAKYQPSRKERDIETIGGGCPLFITTTRLSAKPTPKFEGRIARLNEFWANDACPGYGRDVPNYARQQGSAGGARRDLEDLRAAIVTSKKGLHRGVVRVTLPEKGRPRDLADPAGSCHAVAGAGATGVRWYTAAS